MAEHGDAIAARQVLARPEGPADHRLDAQHTEHLARCLEAEHRLGALATRECQRGISVRSQAVEHAVLLLPVAKVGERDPIGLAAGAWPALEHLHQFVRRVVRQGTQHDGLQETEHGRGDADAQSERADDGRGEQRRPGQHANGEAYVLHQPVPSQQATRLVEAFLHRCQIAERTHGGVARLVGRTPAFHAFVDLMSEVRLDFGCEFVVSGTPGATKKAQHGGVRSFRLQAEVSLRQAFSGSARRTRPTAAVRRSHRDVSCTSCRRPVGVNR